MQEEPPSLASTLTGTVFLSYASQDAEAARRICDALRAAGIEVWFDQSELRGGDAWDRSIRKQIKSCALFIPVISKHTHERAEGYFRLEWNLAVDRSQRISADKAFLVPVLIDDTADGDERVPEKFRELQWTLLPEGNARPEFVTRIQQLLSADPGPLTSTARRPGAAISGGYSRFIPGVMALVVLAASAAYLFLEKPWVAEPGTFSPPAHSVAVLPFVNLSGDKEQEYFSDGLTEELLNSLAAIDGLQVAARTSSFSFKEHPDIVTVAHKLNVASVLEGSVRRSEHTIRVTAQLISATTGFHLWSKTYDRDLGDVLKLQTEIATAVAEALKVTLLGDVAAKIELGGSRNPAAFDAYLRGKQADERDDVKSSKDSLAAYTEAIRLDPNYALGFANRSMAYTSYAIEFATGMEIRESYEDALADARRALALAPDLAEGHLALAYFFESTLDFAHASEAYDRARRLAPGIAKVQSLTGRFAISVGQTEPALVALRRAVVLDPLNPSSHDALSYGLYYSRHYSDAVAAATDAITLEPELQAAYGYRGLAYSGLGDLERARASCEAKPDNLITRWCLAVIYDKLGRHADAEAVLAKFQAAMGDACAYQYATIYAQWGNTPKALEWLGTAMRLRDPGLELVNADPLMDPLRTNPSFQAVTRELKFPD
jgi:TolB-like protein